MLTGRGISHDWRSATTLVVADLVEQEVDVMIGAVNGEAAFVVEPDGSKRLPDPDGDIGPPASLVLRAIAFLIDTVLMSIAWWFALGATLNGADVATGGRVIGLAILAAYFVGFVSVYGQTPGKMAVRLRIVMVDSGERPPPLRAFIRFIVPNLVWVATLVLGLSGPFDQVWQAIVYGVALLRPTRRGLHDLAAGTMVVGSRPEGPDRRPGFIRPDPVDRAGCSSYSASAAVASGRPRRRRRHRPRWLHHRHPRPGAVTPSSCRSARRWVAGRR